MNNQRVKFSLPAGTSYLNCAYMSPLLKSVERAGLLGMQRKRNPAGILAADFYEDAEILRREFATLLASNEPGRIVIIPSASYGLANVAKNVVLEPGDKIIVTGGQFPSNYYPWHRLSLETKSTLQVVSPPDTFQSRGKKWNERILEAIDRRTKVIALGHVHWTDGTRFELQEIRKRATAVGSLLIIDGTQSIGAMPFDLKGINPDALICAGYKWLLGPYSIGLAYYGQYFDNGKPIEENWINRRQSEDFAKLVNYQDNYQNGSLRYEVGEHSNFIMVPMLLDSIRQIIRWKPENIQNYCKSISTGAIERLKESGFWIEDEAYRGHHLFGIRFQNQPPAATLGARLKKRKIFVSFRGDSIRVSPHVYNDADQLDRLADALIG